MDFSEYRKRGKEMVDYIADYLEHIRERRVYPAVAPGYLRQLIPESAPLEPESWDDIIADVERVVMPGVTHWQSPYMHAYFPALNSFPSLLGDMLADAINCLGFTWASSPACTELETVVMNWLGKMIGLPDEFLHTRVNSTGGGVIQTTASEATFVCLLAGRTEAIRRYREQDEELEDAEINSRLVAYCSDQAHSSVEKAGLIGLVKMRYIESDEHLCLRGDRLLEVIARDKEKDLIPFFLCATLGTTGACSFDNLQELGPICKSEKMWLHVDAAYAGTAFICPEFRHWLNGIHYVDSIAFNPSKWMMVHFDCTAMWVRNSEALHRTFNVEPLYLQHENSGLAIDYMHWQIPLSKRFRALKLWFVIRNYGIKGLQKHIREGVRLAQKFEALVLADQRFEIPAPRHLGMVVFRLRGENHLTERLLKRLNARGNLHCVPAALKGRYVIRFTVTSQRTTGDDITRDWAEIRAVAAEILGEEKKPIVAARARVPLAETRELNASFGSSLLLANSPMSPKIVNGSFAAIFDNGDNVLEEFSRMFTRFRLEAKDSPAMRRRIKGILMTGKQFSLDSRMDLVQGIISHGGVRPRSEPTSALPLMEEDSVDGADSDMQSESEATPESTPIPRVRSLSVDEQRDATENDVNTRNEFSSHKASILSVSQQRIGSARFCRKCGHVIATPQ
ncbi:histidine decarboxylase isoform X2 [Zootermopsis nevadensis]|nr:histidine decarboxylase isoform X2 [Zootermopsis nevadensis]XP_021932720.1 histidine decarboxylase isoform X2 [Zootermopsis nevadensis]